MRSKLLVCLFLIGSQLIGCASGRTVIKIQCPGYPIMFKVRVENGVIKGKDVSNVIENHQSLWQYIHQLEKSGCTRK